MKSDNIKKLEKVYKITEKEYAKSNRNEQRLLEIKGYVEKIHRITRQIKPKRDDKE